MTTLYGISNCDSVRKARRWLAAHDIDYRFHDLRKDGLDAQIVRLWVADLGWEALLNRKGRTWQALPEDLKAGLGKPAAIQLMLDHPTVIKRPVLQLGDKYHVGYSDADYQQLFA